MCRNPGRAEQARAWMWSLVEEGLRQAFRSDPAVAGRIELELTQLRALGYPNP